MATHLPSACHPLPGLAGARASPPRRTLRPVALLAVLGLLAGPALANDLPPLTTLPAPNALANPGFENGLASWSWGGVTTVSPGVHGSSKALSVPDQPGCNGAAQPVAAALTTQPVTVLDFHARIDGSRDAPSWNSVLVYGYPQGPANPAHHTLWLGFRANQLSFAVWTLDPVADGATLSMPGPGWHQYTVVMVRPLGQAYLLIDGVLAFTMAGNPAGIAPGGEQFYAGDGSCWNVPNPALTYDEFYLGPAPV